VGGGADCSRERLAHGGPALPALHELDAASLDRLLGELHDQMPEFEDRLRALALARLGAPYALGSLGEGKGRDADPVFRVDEADCTVLVLTTVALAHAGSSAEAERWMGPAGYRRVDQGYPLTYRNRLHFTTDRILSSPLFAEITDEIARPEEREMMHVILNRQESGKELLPIGWEREISLSYVPLQRLPQVIDGAPDLCGIAFVRLANLSRGLDVVHEGILLDRRCLLHASSEKGEVVLVDLLDYVFRRDEADAGGRDARFDGAILYSFEEAPAALPSGEQR
jgi:hypothetical protein